MLIQFTHRRTQAMMSLVSGIMLSVALFVMFPHSVEALRSLDNALLWLLAGLLVMFFMLRMFHFHQHGPAATIPQTELDRATQQPGSPGLSLPVLGHDHDHDHGHACGHGHHHHHHEPVDPHNLNWIGVSFGLGVHMFLDGVALASHVHADALIGTDRWMGLGTFLAIVLEKPLDSMAITSLMAAAGWSVRWQQLVNLLYALTLPVGALAFQLSLMGLSTHENVLIGAVLGFSAGAFLCIALADLLPELEFHSHDQWLLSGLLLTGVGLGYGAAVIEHAGHDHASHSHDHGHPGQPESSGTKKATEAHSHDHEHDHEHDHGHKH